MGFVLLKDDCFGLLCVFVLVLADLGLVCVDIGFVE